MADRERIFLHVCVTCRAGQELAEHETPPGQVLHDALQERLRTRADPAALELRAVKCLASCERGCAAAISMPGKWSYLLGHLDAAIADDVLTYSLSYAASSTGTIMPSRRPESLRNAILARFPAQEFST